MAINKIDKEGANPDRIKSQMAEFNITPEEWGGSTQFVNISALKGDGVNSLLDAILVQAEIMELTANTRVPLKGVVLESKIEPGRGPIATILVQEGNLNKGDYLVVGETMGRARSLMNFLSEDIKSAGPSMPAQVLGLDFAPAPGDIVHVVKNEREARKIVDNRLFKKKELDSVPIKPRLTLENFFSMTATT